MLVQSGVGVASFIERRARIARVGLVQLIR